MYRRPKFLEIMIDIRQEMARDADYDVDLFVEMIRSGYISNGAATHSLANEEKPAAERRNKTKRR